MAEAQQGMGPRRHTAHAARRRRLGSSLPVRRTPRPPTPAFARADPEQLKDVVVIDKLQRLGLHGKSKTSKAQYLAKTTATRQAAQVPVH